MEKPNEATFSTEVTGTLSRVMSFSAAVAGGSTAGTGQRKNPDIFQMLLMAQANMNQAKK